MEKNIKMMVVASQQLAPLAIAKGSTTTCDKCKRKVVDNAEVEQSCKLKQIHL